MASKSQITGMTGVYLVAAELSRRGYVATPTSRNAQAVDLLVSDTEGSRPLRNSGENECGDVFVLACRCEGAVPEIQERR